MQRARIVGAPREQRHVPLLLVRCIPVERDQDGLLTRQGKLEYTLGRRVRPQPIVYGLVTDHRRREVIERSGRVELWYGECFFLGVREADWTARRILHLVLDLAHARFYYRLSLSRATGHGCRANNLLGCGEHRLCVAHDLREAAEVGLDRRVDALLDRL